MAGRVRPGAALVKLRWDKATAKDRAEVGRMLALARKKAKEKKDQGT